MGVNYNYDSIMHYSGHAFGTGGRVTIKAIDPNKVVGNTAGTFSATDIVEINALYACHISGTYTKFVSSRELMSKSLVKLYKL